MTVGYPTTLDSSTFPDAATLSTHTLGTDPHSSLHDDLGIAILQLETKVGITSSADTASLDWIVQNLDTVNLVNGAVTTAKLADGSITQAKFATGYRGLFKSASGSPPASPAVGDIWLQTDTFKVLHYQSVTTGWTKPWSMPWGVESRLVQNTANSGITARPTTAQDWPAGASNAMTLTFTAVANRQYRLVFANPYVQNTDGVNPQELLGFITDGSNTAKWLFRVPCHESGVFLGDGLCSVQFFETYSAGSVTRKIRCYTSGSSNINTGSGTQNPAVFYIEDMGPTANPA